MAASSEPTIPDIVCYIRAFIMTAIDADAVALRPDIPRVRGPLTPLARTIFRTLIFHFENLITGLCIPSIATIASVSPCSESSVKVLLGALYRTEYLSWKPGKRKRVMTRKGWRVVRDSNRYRILCPRRHIAALRRRLIQAYGGRCGPLIQRVIARYTPPTEEAKATEEIVETLAADLRPSPARTASTAGLTPSPRTSPTAEEPIEVAGVTVEDPKLGNILSGLWAALEKRER